MTPQWLERLHRLFFRNHKLRSKAKTPRRWLPWRTMLERVLRISFSFGFRASAWLQEGAESRQRRKRPTRLDLDMLENRYHPGDVILGTALLSGDGNPLATDPLAPALVSALPEAAHPDAPVVSGLPTYSAFSLPEAGSVTLASSVALTTDGTSSSDPSVSSTGQPTVWSYDALTGGVLLDPLLVNFFADPLSSGTNSATSDSFDLAAPGSGAGGSDLGGDGAGGGGSSPTTSASDTGGMGAGPTINTGDPGFDPSFAPSVNPSTTITISENTANLLESGNPEGGSGTSSANSMTEAPLVDISADANATRSGTPGQFTVTRTGPTDTDLNVSYTVRGSAVPGADYTELSGSVTIPAEQSSATIAVTPIAATTPSMDRTVELSLNPSADYQISGPNDGSATVTIVGDILPTLQFASTSGNVSERAGVAAFPVTLNGPISQVVSVEYTVESQSASSNSEEFVSLVDNLTDVSATDFLMATDFVSFDSHVQQRSGTVVFNPGETNQEIYLALDDDLMPLNNETIHLTLLNPFNGILGPNTTSTLEIQDNDATIAVGFETPNSEVDETAEFAYLTVRLTRASEVPIAVRYNVSGGTATAVQDYITVSGTLVFAPGETSQEVVIPILRDALAEGNETVEVTLSGPSNAALGDFPTTILTIQDAAPTVQFDAGEYVVSEGDGSATVTVTLSGAADQQITVAYALSPGTATASADFLGTGGMLTFTVGETSKTFTIPLVGDALSEGEETILLALHTPSTNVHLGDPAEATLFIPDDDPLPLVSVVTSTPVVSENGGTASFTLLLSAPSGQVVSVDLGPNASTTATAVDDYDPITNPVTFAPGETSKTLTVPMSDDLIDEPDEILVLTPSNLSGVLLGAPSTASVTITDDDAPPTVQLDGNLVVNEAEISATVTATLSIVSGKTITVAYATNNGTADAGSDYTGTSGTLTFAPGDFSKTIEVPLLEDTTAEAAEAFTVSLSSPVEAALGSPAQAQVTIIDNDGPATVGFRTGNFTAYEPDGTATVTVQLSRTADSDVTVEYATANGTALADSDYTTTSGTLSFTIGETIKIITVPLLDDVLFEPDEALQLTLSNPTGASLGVLPTATLTIWDDDPSPAVEFSSSSYLVSENEGQATITVTLNQPVSALVTVAYHTSDNTATAGADYTAATGTLTFSAGETSKTFTVPVLADTIYDPNEFVDLTLSGPTGPASLGLLSAAVLTIQETGAYPMIDCNAANTTVNENAGPATVTVSLDRAASEPLTVFYWTDDGTAAAGPDYTAATGTLTFAAGETLKTFTVSIVDDLLDEPNETVLLRFSTDAPDGTGPCDATLTINDNDAVPTVQLSGNSYTVWETQGNARITVVLSAASGRPVTVAYATQDGTANAGSDYTATTGTLTLAAGETSKTFAVPILRDAVAEPNETVSLNLSNPTNATLGSPGTAELTIIDEVLFPIVPSNTVVEGVPFQVTEGVAPSSPLLLTRFWDADPDRLAADYTATVLWGDNPQQAPEVLQVLKVGTEFLVQGSHAYANVGTYQVRVQLSVLRGGQPTVTQVYTTATVVPAALTVSMQSLPAQPLCDTLTNVIVANFTDGRPPVAGAFHPNSYQAIINWGDGSPPDTGTVEEVNLSAGLFQIKGSHTYHQTGSYLLRVTIKDHVSAATAGGESTLSVTPASPPPLLQANSTPLQVTEGIPLINQTVATFTDTDTSRSASDYRVLLSWGDASTEEEVTPTGSSGNWTVQASHTYPQTGAYRLSVAIQRRDGTASVVTATTANVADQALTGTVRALVVAAGQPLDNVLIAELTNPNTIESSGDYRAEVDWGDGSQKTRGVVVGSGGRLWIAGSHTYRTQPGWYRVHVTVAEPEGSRFTASNTVLVTELSQGDFLRHRNLAWFRDSNALPDTGVPTANIQWGDSTNDNGFVQLLAPNPAVYTVSNPTAHHQYLDEQTYTQTVTFNSLLQQTATASQPVRVADRPLHSHGDLPPLEWMANEQPAPVVLAEFMDTKPENASATCTAQIDWGDGSPLENVDPSPGANGILRVLAAHPYVEADTYSASILIREGLHDKDSTLVVHRLVRVTPAVATPAPLTAGQRRNDRERAMLAPVGVYQAALNTGGLRLDHPLDFDQSPGTAAGGDPALVYNSDTVRARPVIEARLSTNGQEPAITRIQLRLIWNNGTPQDWVEFSPSAPAPGDVYLLAAQVSTPVNATGVYPWRLEVTTFDDVTTPRDFVATGIAQVVVNDASPFGPGWWLDGFSRLVLDPNGALLVDGMGDSRYFTRKADGTFQSPPEDFGTLTLECNGEYIYETKERTRWRFNSNGALLSVLDRHGVGRTYGYNGSQLVSMTASDGGLTSFAYPQDQIVITEPGNRVLTLHKNAAGDLHQISDVNGTFRNFSYDTRHHLTNDVWQPYQTTFTYNDDSPALAGDTDMLVRIDQGLGTTYTLVPAAAQGLQTNPALRADQGGARFTDGLNHTTTYTLDLLGRTLIIQRANGTIQRYTRDASGQVTEARDALQRLTKYQYRYGAGRGDLVRIDYADGSFETFDYEPTFHQLNEYRDALGRQTLTRHNHQGDPILHVDALGNQTTSKWEAGLLLETTDALLHTTTFVYDAARRLQTTINALNLRTTYGYLYNAQGQFEVTREDPTTDDSLRRITKTTYDGRNNLLKEEHLQGQAGSTQFNPVGGVSQWSYHAAGLVTLMTDVRGFQTSYSYDSRGWLQRTDEAVGTPDRRSTTMLYDVAGNLLAETHGISDAPREGYVYAHRTTTSYGYDDDNRLTDIREGWQDNGNYDRRTTMIYDDVDNLLSMTTGIRGTQAPGPLTLEEYEHRVTTSYGYDRRDRRTQVIEAFNDDTGLRRTTRTTYDKVGNVRFVLEPQSRLTVYNYDALNRLTSVIEGALSLVQRTTQTTFDAVGNVLSETDALGTVTSYAYDALYRRTEMHENWRLVRQSPTSTTMVPAHDRRTIWSYDKLGNQTSMTDPRGVRSEYVYDALNRRTRGRQAVSYPNRLQSLEHAPPLTVTDYDNADNVLSVTDPLGRITTFAYDSLNRQVGITEAAGGFFNLQPVSAPPDSALNTLDTYQTWEGLNLAGMVVVITSGPAAGQARRIIQSGNSRLTLANPWEATNRPTEASSFDIVMAERRTSTTDYNATDNAIEVRTGQSPIPSYAHELRTRYAYDLLDRQVEITRAFGAASDLGHPSPITTTVYDAADNILRVLEPRGHERTDGILPTPTSPYATRLTTFTYDTLNRMSDKTEAADDDQTRRTTTYRYDSHDNLLFFTSGNSDVTTYTHAVTTSYGYDVLDRRTRVLEAYGAPEAQLDPDQRNIQPLFHATPVTTTWYDANDNIIRGLNPRGVQTTFAYDALNQRIGMTEAVGKEEERQTKYRYDTAGNLLSIGAGRATVESYAHLFTTIYDYDPLNRRIAETRPYRSAANDLDSHSDFVILTGYDAVGNVVLVRNPRMVFTRFLYDALNRRVETYEAVLRPHGMPALNHAPPITTVFYDAADNIILSVDPRDVVTSYSYDSLNRQVEMTAAADGPGTGSGPEELGHGKPVTRRVYDAANNVVQVTDPLTHVVRFGYDALNRQVALLEAANTSDQRLSTMVYDAADNLVSTTTGIAANQLNYEHKVRTDYTYDALNRRSETKSAANALPEDLGHIKPVTTQTYDAIGNLKTVTDPLGHRTRHQYDRLNRRTETTDALQHTSTFAFDAADNLLSVTTPPKKQGDQAAVTSYAYDSLNRRRKVIEGFQLSDQNEIKKVITTMTYYPTGSLRRVQTAFGSTEYLYDALERRAEVIQPGGKHTKTKYDAASNVLEVTDPKGEKTTFVFDALNRQRKMIDPRHTTTTPIVSTVKYDRGGNRIRSTDRNGRVRTFEYDNLNRLIVEKWHRDATSLDDTRTFTYDAANNQLTMQNGPTNHPLWVKFDSVGRPVVLQLTYTFTYDSLNRPRSVSGLLESTLEYHYDANNRRVRVQDNQGGVTDSDYDEANRLRRRWLSGDGYTMRVDLDWNNANLLTTLSYFKVVDGGSAALTNTRWYDKLGRPSNIAYFSNVRNHENLTYRYDRANRLEYESRTAFNTTMISGVDPRFNFASFAYKHDESNQLKEDRSSAYNYDKNGNRAENTVTAGNLLQKDKQWTYGYDEEGNLIRKWNQETIWLYKYDHANQLIGAENYRRRDRDYRTVFGQDRLAQVTYGYDAVGRMIYRSDTLMTEVYVYDGADVYADFGKDENASSFRDLSLSSRYLRNDGADQLLGRLDSTFGEYFYLTDRQGSVVATLDRSGNLANRWRYYGFGGRWGESRTLRRDRYGYTGREHDYATGLQYNRARWYDSSTGRWITQDPLGFGGGDHNLYRYAYNSPTNYTDPSGQIVFVPFLIVGAILIASGSAGMHVAAAKYDSATDVLSAPPSAGQNALFAEKLQNAQYWHSGSNVVAMTGAFTIASPFLGAGIGALPWWLQLPAAGYGLYKTGEEAVDIGRKWDELSGPERLERVGMLAGPNVVGFGMRGPLKANYLWGRETLRPAIGSMTSRAWTGIGSTLAHPRLNPANWVRVRGVGSFPGNVGIGYQNPTRGSSAVRDHVLANIAASREARRTSKFVGHTRYDRTAFREGAKGVLAELGDVNTTISNVPKWAKNHWLRNQMDGLTPNTIRFSENVAESLMRAGATKAQVKAVLQEAGLAGSVVNRAVDKVFKPLAQGGRFAMVGDHPRKGDPIGQQVLQRMHQEGTARQVNGQWEIYSVDPNGKTTGWYPLTKADIAHSPVAAVVFWNQTGKFLPRAPNRGPGAQIKQWMNDPDNLILQFRGHNRSEGSKLAGEGFFWVPPESK